MILLDENQYEDLAGAEANLYLIRLHLYLNGLDFGLAAIRRGLSADEALDDLIDRHSIALSDDTVEFMEIGIRAAYAPPSNEID